MSSRVYIVPVLPVDKEHVEFVKDVVSQVFGLNPAIKDRSLHAKEACDPFRNQYLASSIISKLNSQPPQDTVKIVGITDIDIFEPVFEYLFGEAQLDGLCALISTFRLHNKLYGLKEDKELFFERLYKEVVHEVGHAFGLIHCFAPMCVMNPSTYIEQIDSKSHEFCDSCRKELDEILEKYKR